MALTRAFKATVQHRVKADPAFRAALLTEACNAFVQGDPQTGKAMLRDYINATVGFEGLAKRTGKPSKSLMRMFSPSGNPTVHNLSVVMSTLQQDSGVRLEVRAA